MDLNPVLPPLPTLTLLSTQLNIPPDKPPDPSISLLFPENTQYRVPENPFRGQLPRIKNKEHKEMLKKALDGIRAPFLFNPDEPLEFNGACVGVDMSTETFNAAVTTVIAALERGYFAARDPTPLDPSGWARLSCALLAAVGRGYHRQYSTEKESTLDKVRAEVIDPDPLPNNPTLFHRLAAIADNISTHIGVDQEGYQDWYLTLKNEFNTKATKAAATDVDEKWLQWKADHLEMLSQQHENEIAAQARNRGIDYFISTGQRLGLHITRGPAAMISMPTPTTGRKRTVSGSLPRHRSATPVTRKAPPIESGGTPPDTPRGRTITPHGPVNTECMQIDRPSENEVRTDIDTIASVIKAALGPAIQAAMAPYTDKITALEKLVYPTPVSSSGIQPDARNPPATRGTEGSMWAPSDPTPRKNTNRDGFIPVTHNGRGKKARNQVGTAAPASTRATQVNPTPASYAGVAATAANTIQPPPPPRQMPRTPTITEVTVIRSGGLPDKELEETVRARPADAIIHEVNLKMAKAVAKPIPLKAGQWSVHPRSKGNFVYSFDGNIPFDIITTYEHILLAPFRGSGKLSPSMGWTRLLAHGVPTWDENEWVMFGPEALLMEVKALPGLKRAHLAMPPRWLKPIERIETAYSSITFAISDPDGTITSKLLSGRTALFGKEVTIQRWVDKPALVQCSHCHALGHIRSSRGCSLGKDSVKCFICGGAHSSDDHSQICPRKHEVAGICDCKHFKCLNCHKKGHNCRDMRCPARDLFRPRPSRKARNHKGKGKAPDSPMAEEPPMPPTKAAAGPSNESLEEILDPDGDLYDPPPLPPNASGPQIRTALHSMAIAALYNHQSMEIDGGDAEVRPNIEYDPTEFPEALNGSTFNPPEAINAQAKTANHSPSRPQLGAAKQYSN